ncbi:MAG: hypothetical protein ACI83N_000494 [Hydrogenophaga sp.]|jgi:hypothetical protein
MPWAWHRRSRSGIETLQIPGADRYHPWQQGSGKKGTGFPVVNPADQHGERRLVKRVHSLNTNSVMPGKATRIAVRTKSLATNGRMAR